jgi:hypothetical protein
MRRNYVRIDSPSFPSVIADRERYNCYGVTHVSSTLLFCEITTTVVE